MPDLENVLYWRTAAKHLYTTLGWVGHIDFYTDCLNFEWVSEALKNGAENALTDMHKKTAAHWCFVMENHPKYFSSVFTTMGQEISRAKELAEMGLEFFYDIENFDN